MLDLAQGFARGHHIAMLHLQQADAQVFQEFNLGVGEIIGIGVVALLWRGRG